MSDHRTEIPQSVQSLPSVGAILVWLSGKPIEWWAALIGIFFLLLQIAHLLWKWRQEAKRSSLDLPPLEDS